MYCGEVKKPIDVTRFWGLRYRLSYSAYPPGSPSKSLGNLDSSWCTNLLYYGKEAADPASAEAAWQKKRWSCWQKQFIVPTAETTDPRKEITEQLSVPTQVPTTVVYFFCQCSAGSGNMPLLQFDPDEKPIRHTEIGGAELADHPLIFANACVTGGSPPQIVNQLEKSFFDKKCRAYIGTETRVPIPMASRFASVFFYFFYRFIDSKPLAAGEALSQARRFLWAHYKNLGGLFYAQINQYNLYMASDAEIKTLREW